VPTDWSHALKTGYDLRRDCWPSEVLDRLRVSDEMLPEVVAPGSQLGEVHAGAARATGIPAGTPVVAGMTDSCAAQLAAGALTEGSWNFVLGTTLALKGVSDEPIRDPNGVLYCHRAPGGSWLPGGGSSSGAGILARRFADRDLDELTAAAVEHEDADVVAYPLASRGERFPFDAADAQGFFLGEAAGDDERMAALLGGLALTQRLCLEYAELLGAPTAGELSLTGGAARNRHLCQLSADALERPVRLPESAESAFGMAMLAASAEGSLVEMAGAMVRVREELDPRPERFERCRERYLRLVGELEGRGWLDAPLADHARAGAGG
jgi:sugar (pentulose or hexulose) kinase